MRHIYFEKKEIPRPLFVKTDGDRCYANYDIGDGGTKRIYVGVIADKASNTMYVNDNFKLYYPGEWEKHYGNTEAPHFKYNVGLYSLTLAILHKYNLYDIIHDAFGPLYGNALIDFAMYAIMERANVAYRFPALMSDQVIFSKDRVSDEWLSDTFSNKITEDMIHKFRVGWLKECKKQGCNEVVITNDGSNSDCQCTISSIASKTANKTGNNVDAVSYMIAINTANGMAVTFFMYRGGVIDNSEFQEICSVFKESGIKVRAFLLDKGFLSHETLETIHHGGFEVVINLKSDTYAHTQILHKEAQGLIWNVNMMVSGEGKYGITSGPSKVFKDYDDEAYIHLFFDERNGADRRVTLSAKLFGVLTEARAACARDERPEIPASYRPYFEVSETSTVKDGRKMIKYGVDATEMCRSALLKKGFYSLASTAKMTAREADLLYDLRDISEKTFMVMKSMIGSRVFRGHSDECNLTRGFVAFLALIIRAATAIPCKKYGYKLGEVLPLLASPYLLYMPSGDYKFVNKMDSKTRDIFKFFGIEREDFDTISGEINIREKKNGTGVSQYHKTPEEIREAHKLLRQAERKKKVDKQDSQNDNDEDITFPIIDLSRAEPRKPGRPKGSKNKKTLEREAKENAEGIIKTKRSKGRPRGSLNKKTIEMIAQGLISTTKRKKGRPAGTKDSKPRVRRTKEELQKATGKTSA